MRKTRLTEGVLGHRPRRGVALLLVLVCVTVVTLMLAGSLKRTLMNMRQLRTERHRHQAEWLVEAGLERAAFRLSADTDYGGEVWSLAAEDVDGKDPAIVKISVTAESEGRHNVRVVAEFPAGRITSVRRTQNFLIDPTQD